MSRYDRDRDNRDRDRDRDRYHDRDRRDYRDRGGGDRRDRHYRDRDRDRDRGGDRRRDRKKPTLPPLTRTQRINKMIFEAGDETSSHRLSQTAQNLEEECRSYDDVVVRGLVQCATYLGPRSGVFALLAGLINLKMPAVGAQLAEQTTLSLTRHLREGNLEEAAPLLRFLAQLCANRVAHYNMLAAVYSHLLAHPNDATVGLVLRTLPWAGQGLAEHEPAVLDTLLNDVKAYLEHDDRKDAIPPMMRVMDDDDASVDGYLVWAREQVELLRANNWKADACIVPVAAPHSLALERGKPHAVELPEVAVPVDVTNAVQPQLVFRVFPRDESEKELNGDAAERLVLEVYIVEAMRYFASSLDLAVQRLISLPQRSRAEHILVETILGQLMMLPRPELPLSFYHSLIDSLLRASPRLEALFQQAVQRLFNQADHLDIECRERLLEWLAVHLSNTSFAWPWDAWSHVLTLPLNDTRSLLVRGLLSRCVRLSYWARVEKVMPSPEWVQTLMPPPPEPAVQADAALVDIIKAGQRPQGEPSLEDFVAALLERAQTFSLLKLVLRQYGKMLRAMASTDEAKLSVLRQVARFWADSEGHRLMVVDLFMGSLVVDAASIINWIFSEDPALLLTFSPWEILHLTLEKVTARSRLLRERGEMEKLEVQLREEKDLFLTTFQRFVIVLEADVESPWFATVLSQMVAFSRRYREIITPFLDTLHTVVFSDVDDKIVSAFAANYPR